MPGFIDAEFARELEKLTLVSRRLRRGGGGGLFYTRSRGRSAEFSDHREYAPGDETRFIDWNLCGRLDKLYTKLFLEEDDLHLRLLIDTSASMEEKLPAVQKLAAALGYVALSGGNRVQAHALSPEGKPLQTAILKGKNSASRLFAWLERLHCGGRTTPEEFARILAPARIVGPGITVMLSDFLEDGGSTAPRSLASSGREFYALQMLAPSEADPLFQGRMLLQDAESGGVEKAEASRELFAAYHTALQDYCKKLREDCFRHGGAHALLRSDYAFDEMVVGSLRRVGLLR